jgi:hypothetical protein
MKQKPDNWKELTPRERTIWHRNNKTNATGFLGVSFVPLKRTPGRFEAYICDYSKGKQVFCGSAPTAEGAARLYDKRSIQLYGADAVLNFPAEAPEVLSL